MHNCSKKGCDDPDHRIYVPGLARPGAKVMFIGMAPGQTEVDEGKPLVGSAGYRFDLEIARAGIARDKSWITNGVKFWPPDDTVGNLPAELVSAGYAELAEDVNAFAKAGGQIIVPMGADAIRALISTFRVYNPITNGNLKPQISRWRGSILHTDLQPGKYRCDVDDEAQTWTCSNPGIRVIPTNHPAAILRTWDTLVLFKMDLARIAAELIAPSPTPDLEIYHPNWAMKGAIGGKVDLAKLCLPGFRADPSAPIACDIEVVAGQFFCISFALSPTTALVLNAETDRDLILTILALPNPKVWHKANYDLTFLDARCDIRPAGTQHCTMQMWSALHPELANSKAVGKSLALLASIFTLIPYYKDEYHDWKKVADVSRFYRYNGLDSITTIEIFGILKEKLERAKLWHVYEHDMALLPAFRRAMIRGIPVDRKAKTAATDESTARVKHLEADMVGIVGDISFRSPKQLMEAFKKLGLPLDSTNKDTLQRSLRRSKSPEQKRFIELLLNHRTADKQRGTYFDFQLPPDGRIHCDWYLPGTETGRPTSKKGIIWKGGLSVNTMPEAARHQIAAEDGWTVVEIDLDKAELHIVAHLSGCHSLIEALDTEDIWGTIADLVGGSFPKVALKNCVYGSVYGGGPRKIASEMNVKAGKVVVSESEIADAQDAIFARFKEITEWQKAVRAEVSRTLKLKTLLLGRERTFRPRGQSVDGHTYREALDFVPQGTVPEIINRAVLGMSRVPGWEFWAHTYDGILGQVNTLSHVATLRGLLTVQIKCKDIRGRHHAFVIPFTTKTGPTWGDVA